jgi:hypothetical protein
VRYEQQTKRIYVRQSWLGTYLTCPQRSRYDMTMTKLRRGSDATAIGTAIHSAIEGYLRGDYNTITDMIDAAHIYVGKELEDPTIRRSDISSDGEHLRQCTEAMVYGWWEDIRPAVALGGLIEHKFAAPLVEGEGLSLWLEGTMDYVAPDGTIWDWKTSSRSYSAREKQKHSHQATCYVAAARILGLVDSSPAPTPFRFGVMVRQTSPKSQIVTVERGPAQVEWLKRQVSSVIYSASSIGLDRDWPINDQHNLCSSRWCEYWNICKGVHWDDRTMEPPSQTVEIRVTSADQ